MSEYSKFSSENNTEFICPACGAVLTEQGRTEDGWNCKCGDFIPESMAINPYKGLSNQHKQNSGWR
jgi:tRNA(Ile2) C34 agmatinyltransferase TiaS